ncbi:MAG: nucleotidyltransferase domain-containing protein [Dehalococcoidia bacterium]|nr:nucleotidyltransferase domain-containing protein [Dehalococcoidia bacterium]
MKQSYTKNELKEKLFPIFSSIPIEKAVLFGSYAKGNPQPTSDVDILIDSKGNIKGIDFFGIWEDITETLHIPVDLIEASQVVDGGQAQREIAKTGVVIYERA